MCRVGCDSRRKRGDAGRETHVEGFLGNFAAVRAEESNMQRGETSGGALD